jgi:GLPGLI family protein
MYKKTFNVILVLFTLSLYSQSSNQYADVKISYTLNLSFDKKSSKFMSLVNAFPERATKLETISSEFDYSLMFNNEYSIFYLEKKLYSDNNVVELATIFSGYFGRIKQQDEIYITENLEEDFGKFLVTRKYQDWELHEETKIVGEYLCFKATTYYTTTNPQGKVFKHNFTAWYSPQLPYKYGPLGYGKLPGLIMELQGENFSYGVNKIQFYEKESKSNKMPKLKRLKLITEEELEKLALEDEKRRRR